MCVLVNLESVKCVPALATFCLCQPKKRRGLGALCLNFVRVLRVGAVEGSTLSVAGCVTRCVSVLCVCATGVYAGLSYGLNLPKGKRQPCLSA